MTENLDREVQILQKERELENAIAEVAAEKAAARRKKGAVTLTFRVEANAAAQQLKNKNLAQLRTALEFTTDAAELLDKVSVIVSR